MLSRRSPPGGTEQPPWPLRGCFAVGGAGSSAHAVAGLPPSRERERPAHRISFLSVHEEVVPRLEGRAMRGLGRPATRGSCNSPLQKTAPGIHLLRNVGYCEQLPTFCNTCRIAPRPPHSQREQCYMNRVVSVPEDDLSRALSRPEAGDGCCRT